MMDHISFPEVWAFETDTFLSRKNSQQAFSLPEL